MDLEIVLQPRALPSRPARASLRSGGGGLTWLRPHATAFCLAGGAAARRSTISVCSKSWTCR